MLALMQAPKAGFVATSSFSGHNEGTCRREGFIDSTDEVQETIVQICRNGPFSLQFFGLQALETSANTHATESPYSPNHVTSYQTSSSASPSSNGWDNFSSATTLVGTTLSLDTMYQDPPIMTIKKSHYFADHRFSDGAYFQSFEAMEPVSSFSQYDEPGVLGTGNFLNRFLQRMASCFCMQTQN